MQTEDINRLTPEIYEAYLDAVWAITRKDIYEQATGSTVSVALPMRPARVLQHLKMSQGALVSLLMTGDLARPGSLGKGRVAWRKEEIERLRSLNAH